MIAIIGLIIGIALGVLFNIDIPNAYSSYISISIFAGLDSIFGAVKSTLMKNFKSTIFISGFFGNAVLATVLVYLGDKLGLPVYLAAIIVFCTRIFNNFGVIRGLILDPGKSR